MSDRKPRVISEADAIRLSGDGIQLLEGVSKKAVGAPELSVGKLTIDPGVRVGPHTHTSDTAAYVISGRAAFEFGETLEGRLVAEPGDHIYMPAGVVHTEETLGSEPLVAILIHEAAGGETHYLSNDGAG